MTISNDLLLAILAMDSYNRGYGAGIAGLDGFGSRLGAASIGEDAERLLPKGTAQSAGFYAIAYDWNGQKIIAYRGADDPYLVDIGNGYAIGAGVPGGPQSIMATDFYKAVAGGAYVDPFENEAWIRANRKDASVRHIHTDMEAR